MVVVVSKSVKAKEGGKFRLQISVGTLKGPQGDLGSEFPRVLTGVLLLALLLA